MIFPVVNVICGIFILYMFIFAKKKLSGLPDKIPVNFDLLGRADGEGSKYSVFIYSIVSLIIFIVFNLHLGGTRYPVPITQENRDIQLFISKISYNVIFLLLIWLFYLLETGIIKMVESNTNRLSKKPFWCFIFIIVFIFAPIIVSYIYR